MIWLFLFVFGLCVGSFLNCLVYRLNRPGRKKRHILFGRSYCDHCQRQLAWYDNIPLLSFVFLRGKCRSCHSPIPIQYPIVELVTGILTLVVYQGIIFNLLITYVLLAIFISDLNYQTIPDEIVYPATVLALIWSLVMPAPRDSFGMGHWSLILTGVGGAGFFLSLVLLTRGKGMGMGDVKLAGLMGLILGFPKIIVALYLAFLTGALVGVILVLVRKKRFSSQIPFGPFLTGATFISLFWGNEIIPGFARSVSRGLEIIKLLGY